MPGIYHGFVNPHADSADSSVTRPSNWNSALQYGNKAGSGPSGAPAAIREVLTADRTYYVRPDGNDANSGLANTSTGAFLTISYATNIVVKTLDCAGYNVTVQLASGTYNEAVVLETLGVSIPAISPDTFTGGFQIIGSSANPANVTISTSTFTNCFSVIGIDVGLNGMTLSANGECEINAMEHAGVVGQNLIFSGSPSYAHINSVDHANVQLISNITINSGSALGSCFVSAKQARFIVFGLVTDTTVTVNSTPAFGDSFIGVHNLGYFEIFSIIAGTATGQQYFVSNNSVLNTAGAAASSSYIPGNSSGFSGSGGQVV